MVRRLVAALCFFAVLVGIIYAGSFIYFKNWSTRSRPLSADVVVDLEKGMTLATFAQVLQDRGAIDQAFTFQLWVKKFGDYSRFQAGKYLFTGAVTPVEIVRKIQKGEIYTPLVAQIIIPEGFTITQIALRLAANQIGTFESNLALMKNRQFLRSLNIHSPTAEGYIYPAVYDFSYMPTARDFITKAINNFWQNLPRDYMRILDEKKISLHKAVVIASLIELESAIPQERTMISEVIWRRINKNDLLGIDAALIYGIKDYDGDIKTSHLRDKTNPYNTRVHRGLPQRQLVRFQPSHWKP